MSDDEGMPSEADWLEGRYRDAQDDAAEAEVARLRAAIEKLRDEADDVADEWVVDRCAEILEGES